MSNAHLKIYYNPKFSTVAVAIREHPETICFVSPELNKIFINTQAGKDAKIVRIVPFTTPKTAKERQ